MALKWLMNAYVFGVYTLFSCQSSCNASNTLTKHLVHELLIAVSISNELHFVENEFICNENTK